MLSRLHHNLVKHLATARLQQREDKNQKKKPTQIFSRRDQKTLLGGPEVQTGRKPLPPKKKKPWLLK